VWGAFVQLARGELAEVSRLWLACFVLVNRESYSPHTTERQFAGRSRRARIGDGRFAVRLRVPQNRPRATPGEKNPRGRTLGRMIISDTAGRCNPS
jgi:hypothetical protein